jgi:hypothetical protein
MKNIIKKGLGAFLTAGLMLSACTSDFESINLDERKFSDEQLKADGTLAGVRIMQMQQCIYFNFGSAGKNWVFQVLQNLNADMWSGYMTPPTPFAGNENNNVYKFNTGWNSYMWDYTYEYFMAPSLKVAVQHQDQPDVIALNNILRVAQMHKVSDFYGPIVYRNYGNDKTGGTYESQESVYKAFFKDLDDAVASLKAYVAANPGAKPLSKFDLFFDGDYNQWIKYANSLRLRLAVRVAYVDAALAKTEAEKAVAGGVFEGEEKAAVKIGVYTNPVGEIAQAWGDTRMGASMESYLVGYNDPRLSKMFLPSTDPTLGGAYKGIRLGCDIEAKDEYVGYGNIAITSQTSPVILSSAEVYLLRAEGAVRGWNMGMTAEDAYKAGIEASMKQWGASYDAAAYLVDNSPAAYVDPKNAANNAPAPSSVTPRWDNGATNAEKIEKIVTQRWIACYPEGTEGWAEVRRSGFPKIFPVVNNKSGGEIPAGEFVKRCRFSINDEARNKAGYQKAVNDFFGGTDSHNARLWWDKADKSIN